MSFLRKVSLISFRGSPNNIVPAFISDIHDIWYFLKEMRIKMCFLCSYLISLMFEYVCVHKHYSVFHNYIFILFTLWLNSCSSSFVLLSTPSFCICKKSCAPKKKPCYILPFGRMTQPILPADEEKYFWLAKRPTGRTAQRIDR